MAPQSSLPSSHPLILELASLRNQLAQYQHASHQSAIQLQGSRLEHSLLKDQNASLSSTLSALQAELEVLRSHPAPPQLKPDSTALAELSLAHRRLSAKLDITEGSLSASRLELAAAQQELGRLGKEREGDRATINEYRRIEEEREEELVWQKGETRRAEEQKKLCDLALQEYSVLVQSLDPSAVPPQTPSILLSSPSSLSDPQTPVTPPTAKTPIPQTPHQSSDHISSLLQGQQGVHQLVNDFVSLMTAKEKEVSRLSTRVEELELSLSSVTKQLEEETQLRVAYMEDKDKAAREDASASTVVERYMTFTQKTHATIHMHLDNLRARSAATQASLRKENMEYQTRLRLEIDRGTRLRAAVEEMAEGLSRETAGRRREVALRLKMIAADEVRERKVERWLDRVRRAREGAEGAVLEPDALEGLVDEGVEAVAEDRMDVGREKRQAWRGLLGRKRAASVVTNGEESSITRVLLAEDLVNTLVQDLQVETERRIDLERQRMLLLAREAERGEAVKEEGEDLLVFDVDGEEIMPSVATKQHLSTDISAPDSTPPDPSVQPSDPNAYSPTSHPAAVGGEHETLGGQGGTAAQKGEKDDGSDVGQKEDRSEVGLLDIGSEVGTKAPESGLQAGCHSPPDTVPHENPKLPSSTQTTPQLTRLTALFAPMQDRYTPLQASLRSLGHSLAAIRQSLPNPTPLSAPIIPKSAGRKTLSTLKIRRPPPLSDPVLFTILDNVHEVIEDAKVDVEIALADEERVYRGFEALLNVGLGGTVQHGEVLTDAEEYIQDQTSGDTLSKLQTRVEEIESDLAVLKERIMDLQGIGAPEEQGEEAVSKGQDNKLFSKSVWADMALATVSPIQTRTTSPLGTPLETPSTSPRMGSFATMGRSFSASIVGAPRKVSGFAGNLYRPKRAQGQQDSTVSIKDHEDDVE